MRRWPGGRPLELGIPDPTGVCSQQSNTSYHGTPLYFAQPLPFSSDHRAPYSDFVGTLDSLQLSYELDPITLTLVTGDAHYNHSFIDNVDGVFGLFAGAQQQTYGQISEEIRALSHYDSPVNFVIGGYYESNHINQPASTRSGEWALRCG
jgi:iron complex outermembrane receptor protein